MRFTKGKILLLEWVMGGPTIKGLESMEDIYSGQTTNTTTEMMDFYPDLMRHVVVICKQVSLLIYTQAGVKVVTKTFGIVHTEHKRYLWTESCVRLANGILEEVVNKQLDVLSIKFSAVENQFLKECLLDMLQRFKLFF